MAINNKKKQPTHYSFESYTQKGAFTKICNDMQESPAWKDLTLRQHGLYLYFKKNSKRKKTKLLILMIYRYQKPKPKSYMAI